MKKLSFLLAIILLLSVPLMTACKRQVPPQETPQVQTTTEATTPPVIEQPVVHASISAEQLASYEIIYAKDSSKEVKTALQAIPNILFDAYGVILNQRSDLFYEGVASLAKGQYEILIGQTNREESATFLSNLKWDDYGYGIVGDKLVIAGKNEDGTLKALRAFLAHIEGNTDEVFFTNQNQLLVQKQYPYPNITINGISATDLAIVCNEESLGGVAEIIRDAIIESCGIAVPIVTDSPEDSVQNKIVIGHTNMIIIDDAPEDIIYPTGKEFYISQYAGGIFVDANSAAGYYSAAAYIVTYISPDCKGSDVVVLEQGKHMGEDALPVMSFNLMAGSQSNPESKRIDAVVETILKYRPAVVGVQEATDTWIALLNQRLGDIYTIVGDGRNETRGDEHSAILYLTAEFDCIESGTKWLSDTPDVPGSQLSSALTEYPRIMTYVHLSRKSDGREFLHVNTHLDYGTTDAEEAVKVAQMQVIFDQIKTFFVDFIIITGDFNATVGSPVYKMITGKGYLDSCHDAAFKDPTYHGLMGTTGEPSHIDFIFYRNTQYDHFYLTNMYYRICTERVNNENVSDHYPILTVLYFSPTGK